MIRKIINDPVYGFIAVHHPLIMDIINHPYYQRLRRIKQMAMASFVYPGAVHTRLHHSLGAYHLMCLAVQELRWKGVDITEEEDLAVKCAILLHDIGHGPYSHALESNVVRGVHHEELSVQIMELMNEELGGALDTAIRIFRNDYPKPFLHQLISGQLDMDRLDYLSRDSFYTGVSEGVVGYDRIIKMLTVHDGALMIEEKGIHSVEKFLIARRQMYWQVYLHKAVLGVEKMMVKILERARVLFNESDKQIIVNGPLDFFMGRFDGTMNTDILKMFCLLDDADIDFAVKKWAHHEDYILSKLSNHLLDRKLFKCIVREQPFDLAFIEKEKKRIISQTNIREEDAHYFIFTGETSNTTYKSTDNIINIFAKDGSVKDISAVDNALIDKTLSYEIKKHYLCYLRYNVQ